MQRRGEIAATRYQLGKSWGGLKYEYLLNTISADGTCLPTSEETDKAY